MNRLDKKVWRKISVAGTVVSTFCFLVSVYQFTKERQFEPVLVLKFVSLSINFLAMGGFMNLVFNPLNFMVYALVFYLYGIGNFIDGGNLMGLACTTLSVMFLRFSGFFKSRKSLKFFLLVLFVLLAFSSQIFMRSALHFLISLMHIIGGGFIFFLGYELAFARFHGLKRPPVPLSDEFFSEQDADFIRRVLNGESYRKIAQMHNVSESKVKARMLELYRRLDVQNRIEFIASYGDMSFSVERSPS